MACTNPSPPCVCRLPFSRGGGGGGVRACSQGRGRTSCGCRRCEMAWHPGFLRHLSSAGSGSTGGCLVAWPSQEGRGFPGLGESLSSAFLVPLPSPLCNRVTQACRRGIFLPTGLGAVGAEVTVGGVLGALSFCSDCLGLSLQCSRLVGVI